MKVVDGLGGLQIQMRHVSRKLRTIDLLLVEEGVIDADAERIDEDKTFCKASGKRHS